MAEMGTMEPRIRPASENTGQVVVVGNFERESTVELANIHEAQLVSRGFAVVRHGTVPGGIGPNAQAIWDNAELFNSETVVDVLGGDGTASVFLNGYEQARRANSNIAELRVLFGGGGTEGDNALTFNSPRRLLDVGQVISSGHIVDTYPVGVAVEREGQPGMYLLSMSHGGTHLSAMVSRGINEKRGRFLNNKATKKLHQVIVGLETLADARKKGPLLITELPSGKTRQVAELTVINGKRMGGAEHGVSDPLTRGYNIGEIKTLGVADVIGSMIRLALGRLPTDGPFDEPRSYRIGANTMLHVEGETYDLLAGDVLTFGVHDSPIKVVTTQLARGRHRRK